MKSAIIQVEKWHYSSYDGRWMMEDVRWKKEDGRWMMEEGRWKKDDVRGKMDEGMSDEQMALWYNGEMI